VVAEHAVIERLVALGERGEHEVALEVGRLAAEVADVALDLRVLVEHARRQQAAQPEQLALARRERRALVEPRVVHEAHAAQLRQRGVRGRGGVSLRNCGHRAGRFAGRGRWWLLTTYEAEALKGPGGQRIYAFATRRSPAAVIPPSP